MREPCHLCTRLVTVPETGADSMPGYDGITDDGDPVCPDCWCSDCRIGHADVDERELCGFGPSLPCDSDALYESARDARL